MFIYQQPEAKVNEPACLNPEPTWQLDDGKDTRRTHCTPTVGSLSAVYEPLLLCSGTFLSFIPWMQCMSVVPMVRKKHVFQSPSVQVVDPTAARGRASASRSRSTGRCHACPPTGPDDGPCPSYAEQRQREPKHGSVVAILESHQPQATTTPPHGAS